MSYPDNILTKVRATGNFYFFRYPNSVIAQVCVFVSVCCVRVSVYARVFTLVRFNCWMR